MGFVEAMFLIQQMLDCIAVLVKPIIVLLESGPSNLCSGVVDQLSEGRSVYLHTLTVQGVESRRSSKMSTWNILVTMFFSVVMLSRLGVVKTSKQATPPPHTHAHKPRTYTHTMIGENGRNDFNTSIPTGRNRGKISRNKFI